MSYADELTSAYGRTLPGEVLCVRLETGSSSDETVFRRIQLGLQLVGRLAAETDSDDDTLGVFVVGILPGSVAANDGGIQVGDQLLQVAENSFDSDLFMNATWAIMLCLR